MSEEIDTRRPAWAAANISWVEFLRSDLAEPGVMVRFADNSTMLIGEVNAMGGVCDDCKGAHDETVVVATIDLRGVITETAGVEP